MSRRFVLVWNCVLVLCLLLLITACGTGAKGSAGGGGSAVTITVTPNSAALSAGATQQFQATVTGSSNTAVEWQVNGTASGNAQVGTISSSGLYTAPKPTSAQTITITAVSEADPTKWAAAAVTVNAVPRSGISVSVAPVAVTMAVSTSQQFASAVTGTSNTSVTWSVDGVAGGSSAAGTISADGIYAAPATAGTHTITATSTADTTQLANAAVSVVSMTVSPQTTTIAQSATAQFTADVQGTSNTAVTWSVDGVAGGNSNAGTISATGLYTAPASDSTHTITATSAAVTNYSVSATVTVGSGGTGTIKAINHIIFLSQENRSFDTYFGKLNEYRAQQGLPADVDGLPDDCKSSNSDWTVPCGAMNKAPDANGVPTTPIYAFRLKTMCIENTSADWIASHWDFNAENPSSDTPAMDGYAISAASSAISTGTSDTQGIRAMGFYNGDDLTYAYWLATQFGTSDRWFSPEPARTQPNRYYMVGATSGGQAYPSGVTINQKTIFDLLQQAGVSWKIYSQDGSTSASAFAGFMSRYGSSGKIVPIAQFITDAQTGTLPAVAYIEKPDADQHPGINVNIQDGLNEVRNLVNALMYGPSWKDSVMIVTFDESGGLYDHVPPPTNVPNPDGIKPLDICTSSSDSRCTLAAASHSAPPYDADGDFTRYGFRVPLMVISPFAKPHFVSHSVTDYTAWMKLVETRFGLPSLNARDAAQIDMTEFFDFQAVPWATPPQNPPTINYGSCYDSLP
jgi:phospholipase C